MVRRGCTGRVARETGRRVQIGSSAAARNASGMRVLPDAACNISRLAIFAGTAFRAVSVAVDVSAGALLADFHDGDGDGKASLDLAGGGRSGYGKLWTLHRKAHLVGHGGHANAGSGYGER